jgi:hypothetical protein
MEKVLWNRLGWKGLAAKWSAQSKEKMKKKTLILLNASYYTRVSQMKTLNIY